MNRMRNFQDVSFNDKVISLQSDLFINEFLLKLNEQMRALFVESYFKPEESKIAFIRDFLSHPEVSVVTSQIINHKISSHRALDPIYLKKPAGLLDNYFYCGKAGESIPDRLQAVIHETPRWIRIAGEGQKIINVLIPGSGPGRDIINILANNPDLKSKVRAVCVDNEQDALDLGYELAVKANVEDCIKFAKGDIMDLDHYSNFDIVLLIGIICPLGNRTSTAVVSKACSYLRSGGYMLVSAATKKMLLDDPISAFVMYSIGWKLFYKSDDDINYILSKSNLKYITSFYDLKNQFHKIAVSVKL